MKKLPLLPLICAGILLPFLNHVQAQTLATNVRLRTDPTVRKVIIEYELPQVLPDDSVYIELETASGRILRPLSVNGDVGKSLRPGKNKVIAWDVVRDNVQLNEDVKLLLRVARMVTVADPVTATVPTTKPADLPKVTTVRPTTDQPIRQTPESVIRKKSPLPIIGWAATGGLVVYATVLAIGLNKDADEYNAEPYAKDEIDLQRYQALKSRIDSHKGTFTLVAGAAAAVGIATAVYTFVHKSAGPARSSLLIHTGNRITSIGLSRTF